MNNLLAQRKEIKRLEKEDEKRKAEALEREQEKGEKDERSAVEDFERTMMGLEGRERKRPPAAGGQKMDYEGVGRGVKRKLQGDEEDSSRADMDERGKARKTTDDDEVGHLAILGFCMIALLIERCEGSESYTSVLLDTVDDSIE